MNPEEQNNQNQQRPPRPRRQPQQPQVRPTSPEQAGPAQRPDRRLEGGNRQPGSAKPGNRPGGRPQPARGTNFAEEPKITNRLRRERQRAAQSAAAPSELVPPTNAVPVNRSQFNGSDGQQARQAKGQNRQPANQAVRGPRLRVMPLGGLGEIGKNMMAIEYDQDIVIIDMGFAFPDETQPGIDYIIPDTTYLEKNKHKVRAIVITHGHMDHIGASGYVLPKFNVPVYGSRLSLAFVAKQIEEFHLQTQPQFRVMDPDKHERVQIGAFNLELVRVTHTISDSTAAVLRTPVGTIINTGDWRPDPDPLDGKHMDFERLRQIGEEGVLLLMSDSTNCDRPGHTTTERVIEPTIADLFSRAQNRIIISAFSSSITRVQMIVNATHAAGRKLALVGRSTLTNMEICVKLGYIKVPAGLIVRVAEGVNLPDNQLVILCTGSQGENNSALVRMSTGEHPHIKIKPTDTVILSSSVIPGNEKSVVTMIDNLMREGATVYSRATEGLKEHGPVHVGGHGFRDDVGDLVKLVKPKHYMPIHGEFHHLVYSAEVAVENGVPQKNVYVMDNGDCLEFDAEGNGRKAERIPAGIVLVDGAGVGDVEGVVLRDRLSLGGDGIFVIVATVSRKTGKLISSPDIISRGFIYMKENEELINRVRMEVRKAFEGKTPGNREDWTKFKLRLRDDIGDLLYARTKRSPMILPVVNEV